MNEQLYKKRFENPDESIFSQSRSEAHHGYKEGLEQLYTRILKFQAQSVCHYSRHQLVGFSRSLFKMDDWDSLISDIQAQEAVCGKYEAIFISMRYEENLVTRNDGHMQRSLSLLSKLDGFQSDVKEIRNEMRGRYFSTEESLCYETLRTYDYQAAKDRNPYRLAGTCEWVLKH